MAGCEHARQPWEQAGGSGRRGACPRGYTLADAPSGTPGHDSAPGQQQRPMPVATHAGQESGGRVPLSSTSPSSPSTPSPRLGSLRLASQAPFPASASRARSCASLCLGSLAEGARARDPRRVHDAVTPTRASRGKRKRRDGWYSCPGRPDSGLLRRHCRPPLRQAGPGRLLSLWPLSLWLLVSLICARAPPRARQCPAMPSPREVAAGGRWGVRGQEAGSDPDLYLQGGFHHREGFLDQGRPPTPRVT